MTDIAPTRLQIPLQQEEFRFRAPVSESTWTRASGLLNFQRERQIDGHQFNLNGRYQLFGVSQGPDGVMPCLFDMELVGYLLYNATGGTSGTTTIDLHRLTGGGTDAGTVFSTKPAVDSTASSGSYSFIRLDPAATLQLPTGHTAGVFSVTELDEGDALRFDLDTSMQNGENLAFTILFRPR